MIEYRTGSIFDSGCTMLVCPVNCVGVMGAGLAKEFKVRYADTRLFAYYQRQCNLGVLKPGGYPMFWFGRKPYVCLFPTKGHWQRPSDISHIDSSLDIMRHRMKMWPEATERIAFPMLGCGLGGLNWADVKPLIIQHLGDLPHHIIVFEKGSPS